MICGRSVTFTGIGRYVHTDKSINDDKTITTEYCSKYGFKEGGYYYFFNVLEELDAPGDIT